MIGINFGQILNLSQSANVKNNASQVNFCGKHYQERDVFKKSASSYTEDGFIVVDTRSFLEGLRDFVNKNKNGFKPPFLDEVAATVDRFFTRFDTPAIVKARKELDKAPLTHLIDTPARREMRKNIAEMLYGTGAFGKGKQVYIVMGPPTSGKSTALCEPLAEKKGAMIIDPDIAKEFIPEYNGGKFAGAVHEESWVITHDWLGRAIQNDDNIVLPLVGTFPEEVLNICDKFEQAGYKIHLRLLDVSPEEAAQRAVVRYDKSGRFVDPYYIYHIVGDLPRENFGKLLQERNFDSYASFSNEVPKGHAPILIEKSPDFFDPLI